VAYDLAARLGVAERWSEREVILFGTPAAERYQAEGFFREAAPALGDGFVWAGGEAELSLQWPAPAARQAVLDVAPFRGVRGQTAQLLLNGTPVQSITLGDDRQRQILTLPKDAQRAGENRLRFVFARTGAPSDTTPGNADRRQLAAAFYSLTFGPDGDQGLLELTRPRAPAPFAVLPAKPPVLLMAGPAVVRFAIRVPQDAELRFTPGLHNDARAAAVSAAFRVTIEDAPGHETEAWSRVIGPGGPPPEEVVVRFPQPAGTIVKVGLHVGGASGARLWSTWTAPRILGTGGAALLGRREVAPDDDRRADPLRASLQQANAILVVLDAGRADHLGCYGYARRTTPEIDRIAAEGVLFPRVYTPAVYTLAAMSSVWTSQYPDRHHSEVSFSAKLPKDRLTLAELLSAQGIRTAGFVANAVAGSGFGFERGFLEFHELFREYGSSASAFAHVMPDWLRDNKSSRFFAYLHFREPHFPYDPDPPFDTMFGPEGPIPKAIRRDTGWITDLNQARRAPSPGEIDHLVRLYDGNMAFADQEIGRLRRTLEEQGLWDRTALFIIADHGEGLFEHGWIGHNVDLHEGSIHVPLVVHLPKGAAVSARRPDGLFDLLDVAPTLADLFGVRKQGGAEKSFQGTSLLPAMMGAPGQPAVLSRTVWDRPRYALRDPRYKFVYDTRTGEERLFDLQADAQETRDLAASDPLRTAYFRQELHDWMAHLRPQAGEGSDTAPSREECLNLKSLGYLGADVKCPEQ
jgi:arylsulfatase A-like enzyme